MTKKEARQQNLRTLHPGTQVFSGAWMTGVGLLLRLVPAVCLVVGLYLFTDNAFGLGTPKILYIPILIAAVFLYGGMCWNKIVNVLGWILTGAGAVLLFVHGMGQGMNPVAFAWMLIRSLFNSAVSYMMTVGYGVLYVFKLETPLTVEEELYWAQILFLVIEIAAAMIVAFSSAKVLRVIPVAIVTAIPYILVFLYNISTAKWGFALSVAGICGFLCMAMADKYAKEPRHRVVTAAELDGVSPGALPSASNADNMENTDGLSVLLSEEAETETGWADDDPKRFSKKLSLRGSAAVGYAAVFCTVLALLAGAIPAAKVKNIWRTYDTIDTVMETIRAYEMALITGEDMQISDLGLTGAAEILEARSAIATPRYFTGKTVLEVQSNLSLPVYLRSWVSTTFENDLWHVADEAVRGQFKDSFSDDFRAEDITYRFFRNLNTRLVRYNSKTSYANHEEDGYLTTLISLRNMGVAGNILFLPSRFDSETSLLQYGTLDEPYKKNWINYFDGIAYSRAFHKGAKYSAVTSIPIYKDEEWMQTLNQKLAAYDSFMNVYQYVGSDIDILFAQEDYTFQSTFTNLYSLDRLQEYITELDEDGKRQFLVEMLEVENYNDYVADSGLYTSLTEDDALDTKLRTLAVSIIFDEPLPDTGLEVSGFQMAEGDDCDLTDAIGQYAATLTVGDVLDTVYGTDKGNLYYDWGFGIVQPEGEQVVYRYRSDDGEEDLIFEENDVTAQLDEKLDKLLSTPLVTIKEIRGTDDSLIDTEYYVNVPDVFYQFLSEYLSGSELGNSVYHTAFAQRIAQYLSENMTYTLNPTLPETAEEKAMSSVERFLFVTKEGYCVQYATSATLLLRAVGVPTRYVEGYIADKFVKNTDEDRAGNYICNVKDSNAHAWCEIYLENYGWLTTEVTTPYYSDLYDPYETVSYNRNYDENIGMTETPIADDTVIEDEEDTFWDIWGTTIVTAVIVLAVLAAVVWLLVRFFASRADMRYRHEALLRDAKRYLIEDDSRAAAASALYDNLRRLASALGIRPLRGETPAEYARRLDTNFKMSHGGAESVLSVIEKNEFGTEPVTKEELADFADYIVRLEDVVRGEYGFFTMFRVRYFMGLM